MKWIKSSKCDNGACVEVAFDCEGGACVEISFAPNMVAVRNSKAPADVLWFTAEEWTAFLGGVALGEFNI